MQTTRRSFLKAAAVTPVFLTSSRCPAQESPSDRTTLGFIGMGKQSRGLLGAFMPRCQVVAVCDVDTNRRLSAQRQVNAYYGRNPDQGGAGCKAYVDYQEVLAREDIDAICIATPDHWHAIVALDALRAGKDVYCEKPLTHDIAESVAMIQEVDIRGRVLQTGSHQRSKWEFRLACELARNGIIGKIERIECSFGDPGRPCDLPAEKMEEGLDWNRWIGPAPMRPYNSILSPRGTHNHFPAWRAYKEYGGGMVCDWGAHHLDIAQWALGMDDSGPVKVIPPDDPNAKRGTRLVYANGTEVIHKDGFGVHMFGTEGQIMVNRGKFCFILGNRTIAKWTQRQDGGSLESKLRMVEKDYLADAAIRLYRVRDSHPGDFLECVRSRKKPIAHEGVGGRSAICCHLTNLAYWYKQTMQWDPAAYTFTNGTGDPAWLEGSRRDYKSM